MLFIQFFKLKKTQIKLFKNPKNPKVMLNAKVVARKHPETSEIFTVGTKNPDFSSIRVESLEIAIVGGKVEGTGIAVRQKRVAFVRMETELCKEFVETGILADGKEFPIPGKIIVRESLEPAYEGHEPKINPDTKEKILFMGSPVYRQTLFSTNLEAKDVFVNEIMDTNGSSAIQPNEDF